MSLDDGVSVSPTKKKRDDLQCWRAVAILGVLLFHVWPRCCPNGFLGVDMFFVISGFLMAAIVHKNSRITAAVCVDFYFRRVKRIVPVYLLTLLVVVLLISRTMWLAEFDSVLEDARWAAVFGSNVQDSITQLDYFDMESSHRYFKHCWSISVEMQFYLLVPFMFCFWLNWLPAYRTPIMATLFTCSFALQCVASGANAYESTSLRIWQFCGGILAQSCSFKTRLTPSQKHASSALFLGVLATLFLPVSLPRSLSSLFTVVATSILIGTSLTDLDSPFSHLLKYKQFGRVTVYLGDISYVLYLVHWPIITYFQFIGQTNYFGLLEGSTVIMLSLLAAVGVHHLLEKPSLDLIQSRFRLLLSMLALYLLLSSVPPLIRRQMADAERPSGLVKSFLKDLYNFEKEISQKPVEWTAADDMKLGVLLLSTAIQYADCLDTQRNYTDVHFGRNMYFCETLHEGASTDLTVFVVGNSHALKIAPLIHNNSRFRRVLRVAGSGCAFPDTGYKEFCVDVDRAIFDVLEKVKPDVVLMAFSHLRKLDKFNPPRGDQSADPGLRLLNRTVTRYLEHTRAVIITGADVNFHVDITPEFLRRVKNGLPVDDYRFLRADVVKADQSMRLKYLAQTCPQCVILEPADALCDAVYCHAFDGRLKLPLVRDHGHHLVTAMRRYKPFVEQSFDRAEQIIGSLQDE